MAKFAYSDSLDVPPVAVSHEGPEEQPNDPIATNVPIWTVGANIKLRTGVLAVSFIGADVAPKSRSDFGEFSAKPALADMCRPGRRC